MNGPETWKAFEFSMNFPTNSNGSRRSSLWAPHSSWLAAATLENHSNEKRCWPKCYEYLADKPHPHFTRPGSPIYGFNPLKKWHKIKPSKIYYSVCSTNYKLPLSKLSVYICFKFFIFNISSRRTRHLGGLRHFISNFESWCGWWFVFGIC